MSGKRYRDYSPDEWEPVIRSSVCTGEKVAGFKNRHTGRFEDVMLIRGQADIDEFRKMFRIPDSVSVGTIY